MNLDLSKLSARERKAYESGMIEVRRKLSAGKAAEIERHNLKAARNREAVVKRLGADLAKTCYGVTLPAAPNPSTSKHFTAATAQAPRKKYHTGRAIGGREIKRLSCTSGLF